MTQFVETITKKKIVNVRDGRGPHDTCMSVVCWNDGQKDMVNLVIGARYDDRSAHLFEKKHVKELIDILKEIHEAMEE